MHHAQKPAKTLRHALLLPVIAIALLLSPLLQASTIINGIASHSELGQEAFIGALLVTSPSTDARAILTAQEPKEVQVRVLADRLSSRRFKRMWIQGMAINASASELEKQSANMAKFSNMLKVTLVRGDIVSIQRDYDKVSISVNSSKLGTINDAAFFDLLLRVWIGGVPLSSQFRKDLLLAGKVPEDKLTAFNSITPSDDRVQAVAAAIDQSKGKTAAAAAAVSAPVAATVKKPPVIKAPTVAAQTPKPKPKPKKASPKPSPKKVVKVVPSPKPSPKASKQSSVLAALSELYDLEDVIEEDEEEFTAESLLSQQLYIAKLKKWTYKQLRYPQSAMEKNEEGIVRLSITITRSGKVEIIDIIEEPPYPNLTKEAVRAVSASSPYPSVPNDVLGDKFTFSMPVVFRLVE